MTYTADASWFHLLRSMVLEGDIAKMGVYALAVYLVIKCHANAASGSAFPSVERIAKLAGISTIQVKRELGTLTEMGYLGKTKVGRNNMYSLNERVPISDQAGTQQALATWPYVPSSVQEAVAELKRVLATADLSGAKIINIERLTINLHTGTGNQNQIYVTGPVTADDIEKIVDAASK